MKEAKVLDNYSYEDYLDIANNTEQRVELIFGKIYMMAGASALHQDVVLNIATILKSNAKDSCKSRVAPFDLKLRVDNRVNVIQPDVILFCNEEDTPCAIFEVLSPSTALKDKTVKKALYQKVGVKEYFLVNTEYKIVEKFELIDGTHELSGIYGVDDKVDVECLGLEIELKEIFEV